MDAIARDVRTLADRAVAAARTLTRNGEDIDRHQVVVERVAYAATEARVIAELGELGAEQAAAARVAIAELAVSLRNRLEPIAPQLGWAPGELRYGDAATAELAPLLAPAAVEAIGADAISAGGRQRWPLDDILDEVRANVRAFAEREVVPHAARIHRRRGQTSAIS